MTGPLPRFDPPADWDDFSDATQRERLRILWGDRVKEMSDNSGFPNYYDPLTTDIGDAQPVPVAWTAFPENLGDGFEGDPPREDQGEYCEWCSFRDPRTGKIVKVTFTTEVPEYWETLWEIDRQRVLELYQQWISPNVQLEDLKNAEGSYLRINKWNDHSATTPGEGGAMHLRMGINTLVAGVGVAKNGTTAPDEPSSGFGFHADPVISLNVARIVRRLKKKVSLSNPIGLYLQPPEFNRFELPDGVPGNLQPDHFWKILRGREGLTLRAIYEVPPEHGFVVGDIKVDGKLIDSGSQIARTLKSSTYVTPFGEAESTEATPPLGRTRS